MISLVPVGAGNDRNWCLSPPPAPDSCPPGPPPPHYRGLGLETLVEQVAGIAQTYAPTPLPVVHTGSDTPRPKTTGGGAQSTQAGWSRSGAHLRAGAAPQLQVGAGCSDLQWAPECWPRWAPDLWRAGVFKRTVIFELFWGELSLKKGQQLVIFRLCWACEGEG